MPRIIRSDLAIKDLIEIGDWMEMNYFPNSSEKFLRATEETFMLLSRAPYIGRLAEYGPHADLRRLPVNKFSKYVIFYNPLDDGCEIIRVLHGARNLDAIFAEQNQ